MLQSKRVLVVATIIGCIAYGNSFAIAAESATSPTAPPAPVGEMLPSGDDLKYRFIELIKHGDLRNKDSVEKILGITFTTKFKNKTIGSPSAFRMEYSGHFNNAIDITYDQDGLKDENAIPSSAIIYVHFMNSETCLKPGDFDSVFGQKPERRDQVEAHFSYDYQKNISDDLNLFASLIYRGANKCAGHLTMSEHSSPQNDKEKKQ